MARVICPVDAVPCEVRERRAGVVDVIGIRAGGVVDALIASPEIHQLPERDRRLLQSVLLEERNKDAVCAEFGITREYLRVLLHRAKQSFKSCYTSRRCSSLAAGNPVTTIQTDG
jgi:hypothetical protein